MVLTASGARVVVSDRLVVKVHAPGTDAADLAARMAAAARSGVFAPAVLPGPVSTDPVTTLWRRVDLLDPDAGPDAVPWAGLGALLARLHRTDPGDAPPHGGLARLARAARRGRGSPVAAAARAALADLPTTGTALVHGDLHLGQVGRLAGTAVLLDVDDVGAGDPAWDLGRPAGFWAAGLLAEHHLTAFLDAYRAAGGPGLPATGDPWARLEHPARCAVVVAAARVVERGGPVDESDAALLDACGRMPA